MMSERIKLLAAQCWEPRKYSPAWFDSTRFAELIIQECCSQVREIDAMEINKHFGLKND